MFNKLFSKDDLQTERRPYPFKFWTWLTSAHPSIQDSGEQRAASLAASFLLVILFFTFIGGFARAARIGLIAGFSGPIGISLVPLLLAYGLIKTKWYRVGIFTFALGFSSLAYVSMILEGRQANFGNLIFIYVPLSLIVVSALVSAWATFLLLGLNVGAFLITTSFVISYQPDGLVVLIGLMTTTGLVLIILSNFQKNLEQSRLDELKQINKELDIAKVDLEQRVLARTKDLATVAEVGNTTATILETDKLLHTVVDLTKERFDLYHSHIYLLDEKGENLVLTAGAGEPGRIMVLEKRSIPLESRQSLVARAARERKGIIVNDVTQAVDFLRNPLLPDTRSELAVPMMIGENVIGVFDVQSDQVGRFTESDINIQTTLASQIATSVQNARLYTQAENSKQEAQSLVDYASEAILVLDMETGLFSEPNNSAVSLFGLPREELVKFGPAQLSPPKQPDGRDSTEKAMQLIGKALQGQPQAFDWTHLNAQGQDVFCELRLVKMPGTHPRLRVTITDIGGRKRTEELLTQRAQQQEALNLITQKIQNAITIDGALQTATRELGHVLGMKQTFVTLDPADLTGESKSND